MHEGERSESPQSGAARTIQAPASLEHATVGASDGPLSVPPRSTGTQPASRQRQHLILLPTLNEEKGLEATLRELERTQFRGPHSPPTIAVIDGPSTDGTREVARRRGVTVLLQVGKGKGAAMREGLAWAARQGFTSVAVMDADGTYAAASLPAIFDLLELGSELVVGVRRTEVASRSSLRDLIHRVGNGLLNYTAAQFSRQPVLDVCSGFWGVRTSVLDRLDLESDGFDIEAELFVKSFRGGLRVSQIPVAYRTRVGEAKLHAVRDGAKIFLSILRYSLRKSGSGPRAFPAELERSGERPSLDTVLLALDPAHVILLSARERLSEADAVARRLTSASPNASVVTSVLAPGDSSTSMGSLLPSLTEPVPGVGPIVVVTLPSGQPNSIEPPPVMVGIPRTGRVIRIPAPQGAEPTAKDLGAIAEQRFLPERLPGGLFSALFILSASIEPTWTRRELAILGANARGFPLGVFRQSSTLAPRPPGVARRALRSRSYRPGPVAVG